MVTFSVGMLGELSLLFGLILTGVSAIFWTFSMPAVTFPKIV
jgi:hypothetical protein